MGLALTVGLTAGCNPKDSKPKTGAENGGATGTDPTTNSVGDTGRESTTAAETGTGRESGAEAETEGGAAVESDDGSNRGEDTGEETQTDNGADADEADETANEAAAEVDPNAMKIGDKFRIELAANSTTGYQWQIQTPTDDTVIALASSEYLDPDESAGLGAGGTQVFVFEATGVGSATILIYYLRPWEGPFPDQEFQQEITVVE